MNQAERSQVAKIITATAMYYQRPITSEVVSMMVDDLEDLPFEKVLKAYQAIRRDAKNKFFPLPAQVRELICPVMSVQAQAREDVENIKIAITDFGYMRGAEARAAIGEIGWRIVEGLGGWQRVCESNFIHNSALIAQARARGEDLINYQGQILSTNQLEYSGEEPEQIEHRNGEL
jgi:hypothetical protein